MAASCGVFCYQDEYKRSVPSYHRVSKDSMDSCLTYGAANREQHIRRIKRPATFAHHRFCLPLSRILCVYHGAEGLRLIAGRVHRYAQILRRTKQLGHEVLSECYFDTIVIHVRTGQNDLPRTLTKPISICASLTQTPRYLVR